MEEDHTNATADARGEHVRQLALWRSSGGEVSSLDVLAEMPDALPSIHAAYALVLHEQLLRNMTNVGLNDIHGDEAVHAAWAAWSGMVLHNMPYIAAGQVDEEGDGFLRRECEYFVRYAGREPVPARWHPDHPGFGGGIGHIWKRLCDHVAGIIGVTPAYGIPAVGRVIEIPDMPVPPKLGVAERFLPAPLRAFLKEYETVRKAVPSGAYPTTKWTRWRPETPQDAGTEAPE